MLKRLLNSDSRCWVVHQHPLQKVNCFWFLTGEHLIEFTWLPRLLHKSLLVILIFNSLYQLVVWITNQVGDHLKLLFFRTSWHQGLSQDEFSKDTTNSPYINCSSILLVLKHDLRSSVPSRHHVVSHPSFLWRNLLDISSGQTEIAYLQVAIGVYEKISGFEIPVINTSWVSIFEPAKYLIQEELQMVIR